MVKQCTKFKISTFTHHENMTDNKNTEIGRYGSLKVIGNIAIW